MSVTSEVVLTGTTVILGRWAKGEEMTGRPIIGLVFFAVGLAVMSEIDNDFASKMGALVLVVAAIMYVPDIAKKAGLIR